MISFPQQKALGQSPRLAGVVLAILGALAPVGAAHTLIANDSRDGVGHWSWCAVNRGTEVDFYRYVLEGSDRGVRPFEIFQPSLRPDEIIFSGNRLGVRSGRSLQFFDVTASFRHLPQFDFQLPAGTNELLLLGDRLGVRTGRTLRFYNASANYRALPKFDYTVPAGTDELVIAENSRGTWLGVRTGTKLQFHNIDRGYKADPNFLFTLPAGTDEVVVAGPLLVVMSGEQVALYNFLQRSLDKPLLVMNVREPAAPPLETLRGNAIVDVSGSDEKHLFSFWAKGNRLRTEEVRDGKRSVTIQHDDTLYSYTEGERFGAKGSLGNGLASMALINQIAEVKAHGERGGSKEIDGIQYHQYTYQKTPEEVMVGTLSATSSLPGIWTLGELEEDGRVIQRRVIFRDLEANVAIPDKVFELPRNLTIQE